MHCDFGYTTDIVLLSTYRCNVENHLNTITRYSTVISRTTGQHHSEKSNDNVTGLYAYNKNIQYLPKGIKNVFKNIKRIGIEYSGLCELTQDDMKSFPKLIELNLLHNDLISLENGIFHFNLELVYIDLSSNQLISIESEVFKNLKYLAYLKLNKNDCIDKDAVNRKSDVNEVIAQVNAMCIDAGFVKLKFDLTNLENDVKLLNQHNYSSLKTKIVDFQIEYRKSKFITLSTIVERINGLHGWMNGSKSNVEEKYELMLVIMGIVGLGQVVSLIIGLKIIIRRFFDVERMPQ